MVKLINWLNSNILPKLVVFLLIFIPLYPKLPLLGVSHTWVYIRLEDIFVSLSVLIWFAGLLIRKIRFPRVITFPVITYWVVGFISTIIAITLIFPHLANVFLNVAIFNYIRRIEYIILLFIASSTIKKEGDITKYIIAVSIALLGVILYGFGQKFGGFPAFLTMNEEFAKGIPLYLPAGARITSTFGGHYDLAAYLVLIIALLGSLIFGVKQKLIRFIFLALCIGALSVLLLTASRVSFAVYLITVTLMLVMQKKKIWIIPVVIFSIFLLVQVRGTAERFAKTFRIQPIVFNTATGQPIAVLEKLPSEISGINPQDTLPLGSGFIALPPTSETQPVATSIAVIKRPISSSLKISSLSAEISTISGSFLIQKAFVYDISFTTRFQGEWPRAWKAFLRNPLTGSGYSSISLATDNDYLRLLGESGIVGFLSFLFIFSTFFILVKRKISIVKSPIAKCFVIGVAAGIVGLGLNAILIDVFEASKVAFILWLLIGISIGIIELYDKTSINLFKETRRILTSELAILIYLFVFAMLVYGNVFSYYFVGDDFVWLKWAAQSKLMDIVTYFNSAQGFFYRPLPKLVYFVMYAIFWFKSFGYHFLSIFAYFLMSLATFLIAKQITRKTLISVLAAFVFLVLPINSESVIWISSYSGILMSTFLVYGLYFFTLFIRNKKKQLAPISLVFFIFALFFHEGAVVFPLLVIWYLIIVEKRKLTVFLKHKIYLFTSFLILGLYFWIRFQAHANGLNGDYNYNLTRLPFNVIGNLVGYISTTLLGSVAIPFYNLARISLRTNLVLALILGIIVLIAVWLLRKKLKKFIGYEFLALIGLYIITLLPYLGLGNLSEKYALASSVYITILYVFIIEKIINACIHHKSLNKFILVFIVFLISAYYLKDLNGIGNDWKYAGDTARRIIYAVKDNYRVFPKNTNLYFSNIPIRYNRAWIYPIGLKEALWFVYRDNTMKIIQTKTMDDALKQSEAVPGSHVFNFENNELKEVRVQ